MSLSVMAATEISSLPVSHHLKKERCNDSLRSFPGMEGACRAFDDVVAGSRLPLICV
jgi:hypothetical protein